jgi:hypothetical protein
MSQELDRTLLAEAMQRLGKTPDGRLFYMHLQTVLLGIPTLPMGIDVSGALREDLGRRLLARDIRNLMAPGVVEIDPKVDDRPTIFKPPEPARLIDRKQRGAVRRVTPFPRSVPAAK